MDDSRIQFCLKPYYMLKSLAPSTSTYTYPTRFAFARASSCRKQRQRLLFGLNIFISENKNHGNYSKNIIGLERKQYILFGSSYLMTVGARQ